MTASVSMWLAQALCTRRSSDLCARELEAPYKYMLSDETSLNKNIKVGDLAAQLGHAHRLAATSKERDHAALEARVANELVEELEYKCELADERIHKLANRAAAAEDEVEKLRIQVDAQQEEVSEAQWLRSQLDEANRRIEELTQRLKNYEKS